MSIRMTPGDRARMRRLAQTVGGGGLVTEHRLAQLALLIGVEEIERDGARLLRAINAAPR